ncbi:abortive phage resistance protein [Pseudoduganella umbonata]|nr:abortive phage resistance protein [Pseudoduganella umbonata]
MFANLSLIEKIEVLQDLLVDHATGGGADEKEYKELRAIVIKDGSSLGKAAPTFLRTCRDLSQFWQFIKFKFPTYAERRRYLWDEFSPLLEQAERVDAAPSDAVISSVIALFDSAHVMEAWHKALERRGDDPEGAITMARTLLESVCKHIIEERNGKCDETPDMNKLYRQAAELLNIAPSQHSEPVFKQILGGCTAVVEGLGALRNRLGDSHGKVKAAVKPAARHAELAVNLAGTLAMFLLATSQAQSRR